MTSFDDVIYFLLYKLHSAKSLTLLHPTMARQYKGPSLKDDITSIKADPTFHDVTIVTADGVEIGANSTVLASRSAVFKAMFFGGMQESASRRVILREIDSVTLRTVLLFIYTDDITLTISKTIEVYCAAHFLLLPMLMELVLEQANNIKDIKDAVPLLNEALVALPWGDDTKDLYEILLKPFCNQSIAIGSLNELSDEAFELLLTQTTTRDFNTNEYDLLLCIVEWAWVRTETAPPAIERYAIFKSISNLSEEPSPDKIFLGKGPSRVSLLKMMRYVDLTLMCPHRLKSLTDAIDVFDDELPHTAAFCHHACMNVVCAPRHPSEYRGIPLNKFHKNPKANSNRRKRNFRQKKVKSTRTDSGEELYSDEDRRRRFDSDEFYTGSDRLYTYSDELYTDSDGELYERRRLGSGVF